MSTPSSSSASSIQAISRRRACTACRAAKRRCDQQLPRCWRCAQKGFKTCTYADDDFPKAAQLDLSFHVPASASITPNGAFHDSQEYFQHRVLQGSGNRGSPGTIPSSQPDQQPVPVLSDYENPWPILFDATGPAKTTISRDSLVYTVQQLRSWPARWAHGAMTPFINPALYTGGDPKDSSPPRGGGTSSALGAQAAGNAGSQNIPLSLQDAFAVCAAYNTKTDANAAIVFGLLEAKADALVYSSGQSQWTVTQQLAAIQALILYQIMRLFDGDIRQRAMGEAVEQVLAAWVTALQARVGGTVFTSEASNNISGAGYLSLAQQVEECTSQYLRNAVAAEDSMNPAHLVQVQTTPTANFSSGSSNNDDGVLSWRRWLLSESIRRTVITAFLVRSIYATAKQGHCRLWSSVTDLSFTGSSRLWAATTAARWRRAAGVSKPLWIAKMDFSEMFSASRASEVDDFAVIMAVVYRGRDVVQDWLTVGVQGLESLGVG